MNLSKKLHSEGIAVELTRVEGALTENPAQDEGSPAEIECSDEKSFHFCSVIEICRMLNLPQPAPVDVHYDRSPNL